MDDVKRYVQSLHKGSDKCQYVVQNLRWSGVYLRSTLSNTLLQRVLPLVPLTATVFKVFVAIMTTFISDSYDVLEYTLNQTKSLNLKIYPGDNVIDYCAETLVDAERLDSAGIFKP